MIELLTSPEAWVSLLVLSLMEIVLGIDNIVFITIMSARLPKEQQHRARQIGLIGALLTRILLLLGIGWVMQLEDTLFTFVQDWSGKDLILFGGGLFLLWKATKEIHESVEHPEAVGVPGGGPPRKVYAFWAVIVQIMLLDIVFSLDSVITAVGMAEHIPVMVAAILIAVGVMLVFVGPIGDFVERNPSVRVLALAFLVLIGAMLIMEGTGQHVSKGYIYSAMAFSLFVQLLNMRMDSRRVRLETGQEP